MKSGILSTIGNTPIIRLEKIYPESTHTLYAKLEMCNPGGSIKDRPAFRMISEAMEQGKINRDSTIIESSSGNMAIGLAKVCLYYGLKLIVVVDPKINAHTLQILKAYGVTVEIVDNPDASGNYLMDRLRHVQRLLDSTSNSYWPNQYANRDNPAAHHSTMKEICSSLPEPPDYILAAASTCGTIMGCANYIRQNQLHTKVIAVDAVGSLLFGDCSAERQVPGHGAGRKSELLDISKIEHVIHISDSECIDGCQRLLHHEAILAGGSSGAIVAAVEKLKSCIPQKSTCVLLLADRGERYLDTIYNDDWVNKNVKKSASRSEKIQETTLQSISTYQNEKHN